MKFFASLILLAISIVCFSQARHPVLFGVSRSGNGGIFRYTEEENEFKNVYRFKNSGTFRGSHMVVGKDGIIYGVAEGGPYGYGIIYSLDPATSDFKNVLDFSDVSFYLPGPLTMASDGLLYGIASSHDLGGNYL